MFENTSFTLNYLSNSSDEYIQAASTATEEVGTECFCSYPHPFRVHLK